MKHYSTPIRWLCAFVVLFFWNSTINAQTQIGEITGASTTCSLAFDVCDGDTITLQPSNTVDYTNIKWYFGSIAPANEITAVNAAQNVAYYSNDTIKVVSPGGMYIMTGEFATAMGCSATNDTINLNFNAVPNLVTTPDTICNAAGQGVNLATLVIDSNPSTAGSGSTTWFATLADANNQASPLIPSVVSPMATTMYYVRKNSGNPGACYDIDSVQIVNSCLNLGNLVWYDTNNNGTIDGSEPKIDGVIVQLFKDVDNSGTIDVGEDTPIASDTTTMGGLYLFENLPEGSYFVGIPSSEFGTGKPLQHLSSSQTARGLNGTITELTAASADLATDTDDNGTKQTTGFYSGGILSSRVNLAYLTEPTLETPDNSESVVDANDNLTVDFGFYGMSIGSFVFTDVANDGTFTSGTDAAIPGVTVKLYSGDGTTLLHTTTTDAAGKYLFVDLPEGNYIVAVDTSSSALDGYLSSDDIATTNTPSAADNDDNGADYVSGEVRSKIITLDAGAAPTGESDQASSLTGLSIPAVSDNALTPDANSDMRIDFGFKPICPTITNPTATVTRCLGVGVGDLVVQTSQNAANSIRFVAFTSPQTGMAMYTGGTNLGTVTPSGSGAPYTATYSTIPANFAVADTFYVYAVLDPASADATCRPVQEIKVIINPLPAATATNSGPICAGATVSVNETGGAASSWAWTTTGSGTFSSTTAKNPSVTGVVNGDMFTVVVTDANTCTASSTTTVTVNPLPTATASNNGPICAGASVAVNETGGAATSWAWTTTGPGVFSSTTAQNPTVTGVTNGNMFTVVVTDANTCTASSTTTVTVATQPTASPASLTACESTVGGGTADFTLSGATATVQGAQTGVTVTYHATQAAADAGTGAITTVTAAANGATVVARVTVGSCYATSIVTLNVNYSPQFSLALPAVCPGMNPEVSITLGTNADANPSVKVNAEIPVAFSTISGGILTTAEGIVASSTNTVILTNANTCTNTKTIAVPGVVSQVCLPVQIIRN